MSFSGTKGYITKPKPGVMLNPLHPLSRGLVGYWLFNEGAGSLANDISGLGNHGTLTNMAPNVQGSGWGNGKFGGSLQFDGSNDYVEVADNNTLDLLNGFTIKLKLKLESNTGEWSRTIVSKSDSASSGGGWAIYQGGTSLGINKIQVHLPDGAAPSPTFLTDNAIPIGENFDLNISWDGTTSSDSIQVYFNTIQQAGTESNYGTTNIANNLPMYFGLRHNGSLYIEGYVQYISIHNRNLLINEKMTQYYTPFCNLLQVPMRRYYVAAPPVGVIMNQFQRTNIGADLYNGVFA